MTISAIDNALASRSLQFRQIPQISTPSSTKKKVKDGQFSRDKVKDEIKSSGKLAIFTDSSRKSEILSVKCDKCDVDIRY